MTRTLLSDVNPTINNTGPKNFIATACTSALHAADTPTSLIFRTVPTFTTQPHTSVRYNLEHILRLYHEITS